MEGAASVVNSMEEEFWVQDAMRTSFGLWGTLCAAHRLRHSASAVSNMERLLWARDAMVAATTACKYSTKKEPRALQRKIRTIVGMYRHDVKIMPTLEEEQDVDADIEEIRYLIHDELSLNVSPLLAQYEKAAVDIGWTLETVRSFEAKMFGRSDHTPQYMKSVLISLLTSEASLAEAMRTAGAFVGGSLNDLRAMVKAMLTPCHGDACPTLLEDPVNDDDVVPFKKDLISELKTVMTNVNDRLGACIAQGHWSDLELAMLKLKAVVAGANTKLAWLEQRSACESLDASTEAKAAIESGLDSARKRVAVLKRFVVLNERRFNADARVANIRK